MWFHEKQLFIGPMPYSANPFLRMLLPYPAVCNYNVVPNIKNALLK